MVALWNSKNALAVFSHEYFPVDAVSWPSEKRTFKYCIPVNKCLLKLSLISGAKVPSWRESPGSGDGFIVL